MSHENQIHGRHSASGISWLSSSLTFILSLPQKIKRKLHFAATCITRRVTWNNCHEIISSNIFYSILCKQWHRRSNTLSFVFRFVRLPLRRTVCFFPWCSRVASRRLPSDSTWKQHQWQRDDCWASFLPDGGNWCTAETPGGFSAEL